MKKVVQFLLTLGVLTMVGFGCNKEPIQNNGDPENLEFREDTLTIEEYEYRLDGEVVSEDSFSMENDTLNFAIEVLSMEDTTKAKVVIYAFTTLEKYYEFGDDNELPFRTIDDVAEILYDYADTSGAITEYETYGELPDYYEDYQEEVFQDSFSYRTNLTILHKDFDPGPGAKDQVCFGTFGSPVMWPGWNNEVSAFTPAPSITPPVNVIFDLSFYRKRLATIVSIPPGFVRLRFLPGTKYESLNDNASSWLCY